MFPRTRARTSRAFAPGGEAELYDLAAARRHFHYVARCGFRSTLRGAHGVTLSRDHVAVERIFHVRLRVRLSPECLRVAFVLGEEELRRAIARERVVAQLGMRGDDRAVDLTQDRPGARVRPTTTCFGTTMSAAAAAARLLCRGYGPTPGSGCRLALPWRTRGRRRSTGRR